ncbi:MAG TPA: hypothetical protein VGK48_09680 [Terriglobia bacterium]|jgi:hypothetical protein
MNVIFSMLFLTVMLQARAPVFEIDLWPGEGVPRFEAVSKELMLHELPLTSSRIVSTVAVLPGQNVDFDDTLYRTVEAGRIEVLQPSEIDGRVIGKVNRLTRSDYNSNKFKTFKRELQPKMIIEYIQDRAEGTCFLGIDGEVLDTLCPTDHDPKLHVLTEPKTEWWIHVVLGVSAGWIQVSDSTVRDVR